MIGLLVNFISRCGQIILGGLQPVPCWRNSQRPGGVVVAAAMLVANIGACGGGGLAG